MDELKDRIARFRELREKAADGKWQQVKTDGEGDSITIAAYYNVAIMVDEDDAPFIVAAANDALPLLADCQREMTWLEDGLQKMEKENNELEAENRKLREALESVKATWSHRPKLIMYVKWENEMEAAIAKGGE